MPTISNLSFSVRFNLTGTPALVLTDTTTSPPTGLVGIFSITQPDGYTRTGNINSPDISAAGGSFSYTLTLDATGNVQCGTYTIIYSGNAPGYLSTNFTRQFTFDYTPVSLVMTEDFDVFTPLLRYIDGTTYSRSGYSNGSVTRSWTAVSTPTGTLTGSTSTFNLAFGGQYYDANYTITLTSSLLYTNTTYNWLTVQESITKTVSTYAQTPPGPAALVASISALKKKLDDAINSCQTYDQLKDDFEYAETLFSHIMEKIKVGDLTNIYVDFKDLLRVLNNYQIPTYVPTNAVIPAYNISIFYPSATWGSISGTITNQTDLVNYIASQSGASKYSTNIGDGTNTSYTVTHNLNNLNILVEIFENSSGYTVYADVDRTGSNTIVVSFASAPTLNQYRVVII